MAMKDICLVPFASYVYNCLLWFMFVFHALHSLCSMFMVYAFGINLCVLLQ